MNIASCTIDTGVDENVRLVDMSGKPTEVREKAQKSLSCNTLKIVEFMKGDEIYIREMGEMGEMTGIYTNTSSYFGLIQLG